MNSKELFAALEAAGWRVESNPLPSQENRIKWYAYRRLLGATDCICNDKPPSIVITPYEFDLQGKLMQSADFEVTGETAFGWVKFAVYGISFDDVLIRADEKEIALRAAWEAVAFKGVA